MAESYGVKPKKFTKEWWPYFWDYYKWYVVAIAVLLAMVIGMFVHCKKMEKYDLTLTYAGPHYFQANHVEQIAEEYSKICEDLNKDGERHLMFANTTISTKDIDAEYKSSMMISLQFALEEEEKYIFIIHKDFASPYVAQTAADSRYAPTKDWLTANVGDVEYLSAHNLNYGVSLEGSKIFEKWNCDLKDHYLFIRSKPTNKEELPAYNAAIKMANELLGKK